MQHGKIIGSTNSNTVCSAENYARSLFQTFFYFSTVLHFFNFSATFFYIYAIYCFVIDL